MSNQKHSNIYTKKSLDQLSTTVAELGLAQPQLVLNIVDKGGGVVKGKMFYWGLQTKSNNFYFEAIALSTLNQTCSGKWVV